MAYPEGHPDGCMCDTCREIRMNEDMETPPVIDNSDDSVNVTIITPPAPEPVESDESVWMTTLNSLNTRLDQIEAKLDQPAIVITEPPAEEAEQVIAPVEASEEDAPQEVETKSKVSRTPKHSIL